MQGLFRLTAILLALSSGGAFNAVAYAGVAEDACEDGHDDCGEASGCHEDGCEDGCSDCCVCLCCPMRVVPGLIGAEVQVALGSAVVVAEVAVDPVSAPAFGGIFQPPRG